MNGRGAGSLRDLRDLGPSGPLPRRVHTACVGVVFADGIITAHDLVGLDRADTQCPDESVFDGLGQGWGSQCARGSNGPGDGYVGRFDAVVEAEGVKPLEIEAAHVCRVEPVVCVNRNVFA